MNFMVFVNYFSVLVGGKIFMVIGTDGNKSILTIRSAENKMEVILDKRERNIFLK